MKKIFIKFINILPEILGVPFAYITICITKKHFVKLIKKLDKRSEYKNPINSILVIRLDAIGDFIWNTAFIRELRRNYPKSYITLVIREQMAELAEHCPYVDEIRLYDTKQIGKNEASDYKELQNRAKKFCNGLQRDYDVAILPRQIELSRNIESLLIASYSNARAMIGRTRYYSNFDKALYWMIRPFFNILHRDTEYKHQVIQILDVLKCLGGNIKNDKMELWVKKEEIISIKHVLEQKSSDFYVMVGLRGSEPKRDWDPLLYNSVFREIQKIFGSKICFVLCGDKKSKINATIAKKDVNNCLDLTGKTTLRDLISLGKCSDAYLGSDTGILHVAAAFSTPIIELSNHIKLGSKDTAGCADVVGPWGTYGVVLEPERGLDDCKDECDKNYSHCINQITVEQVVKVLKEVIYERNKNNCKLSPTISRNRGK